MTLENENKNIAIQDPVEKSMPQAGNSAGLQNIDIELEQKYPKSALASDEVKKQGGGVDICFQDLKYSVQIKVKDGKTGKNEVKNKVVLDNLSGICKSGQVTAIMGSSGAGKTSLLNILCKRIQKTGTNNLSGTIKANSLEYSYNQFPDFASYIMQDDRLMETMTIYECLLFAARLKVKGSAKEQEDRVEQVIKQLKLQRSRDTLIGGDFVKGISGGERKRCSIGFELVTNPDVLFLDEPTSGLDSFTAFIVINQLKQLAKEQNKTIVCTIHQPSSDIWNLFDRVILLNQGKFIYQGKGGINVVNHFTSIGFQCPEESNPADYLMSIMHKESKVNVENFPKYYEGYDKNLAPIVKNEIQSKNKHEIIKHTQISTACTEISQIYGRTLRNMTRNPLLFKARIGQTLFMALFSAAIYWQLADGSDDPTNVRDINNYMGFFFFQTTNCIMLSVSPVVLTFPSERGIFLKEENSKLYRIWTYFLGRTLLELPLLVIFPTIQSIIQYFTVGLSSETDVFFRYILGNIVISLVGNSLGLLVGCAFSDAKVASGIMPMMIIPFMLFGGFYSNRDTLWAGVSWIEYISPFKYGFDLHVNNNFEETDFRPSPVDMLGLDLGFWNSLLLLGVLFFGFRALAFTLLYIFKKRLQ